MVSVVTTLTALFATCGLIGIGINSYVQFNTLQKAQFNVLMAMCFGFISWVSIAGQMSTEPVGIARDVDVEALTDAQLTRGFQDSFILMTKIEKETDARSNNKFRRYSNRPTDARAKGRSGGMPEVNNRNASSDNKEPGEVVASR